jgi:hypothetical protein
MEAFEVPGSWLRVERALGRIAPCACTFLCGVWCLGFQGVGIQPAGVEVLLDLHYAWIKVEGLNFVVWGWGLWWRRCGGIRVES